MVEEKLKELAEELKTLARSKDPEGAHLLADEVLLMALAAFGKQFGFEVEVGILRKHYEAVKRWYA